MASLWQRFLSRPASGERRRHAPARRPQLFLEPLEERCVPTTFNVNTTLDLSLAGGVNPNGTIVGMGNTVTLRSAIQAANNTPGGNTINLTVAGDYKLTLAPTNTNVIGALITSRGFYTSTPAVSFSGGGGTGAAGFAFLNPTGTLNSITITNGGTGYTSAPTINITGGGSGATATALVGEDDNLAGELAILPAISGSNLVIQNVSGGGATLDGNNAFRDLDVNPNFINAGNIYSVTIAGVVLTNGLAAPNGGAASSGGGVRDQGAVSLTLNNDVITNNYATAAGGGVAMEDPFSEPWTLSLTSTVVSNNHAGDAGGGLETDGGGTVNLNTGCVITGNSAADQGGGVWLDAIISSGSTLVSATLNVTDAVISNNAGYGVDGGIGQAGNSTVTIANSTVENNVTPRFGGGFGDQNNKGTLVVVNSFFVDNKAGAGGGIQEGGPSTTITNTEIKGNSASTIDGGVSAFGGTLTMLDCTIADNTAVDQGGGIDVQVTGASSIINTTIVGNSALSSGLAGFGGGLFADLTGTVLLRNDTINGNFAETGGGVFWTAETGAAVQLQNTIVARNTASYVAPNPSTANFMAPDAFSNTGALTDLGGNIIGSTIGNTGFIAATTQIGVNPQLDTLGNNLGPLVGAPGAAIVLETEAITGASPAFDKGVASLGVPTTDERGFPRPDDGANELPDIGAFEYQDGYAAATFPRNGVWRFNAATGQFVKLGTADAALLAVDQSGDIAAAYSGQGVYLYKQSTGLFTQITPLDASALAIDAKGDVFADLSNRGVFRYDGASLDQLSMATATLLAVDAGGDVAAEFPGAGVWRFLASSGQWTQIAQANASLLAIDRAGDVFADLAGLGVWRYTTATGFQQLTTMNATQLASDALGDLAAVFHGMGVWRFTAATGAWVQIGSVDPSLLTMDDGGDIFAEFPGSGVYENTLTNGWMQIGTANADVLAAS